MVVGQNQETFVLPGVGRSLHGLDEHGGSPPIDHHHQVAARSLLGVCWPRRAVERSSPLAPAPVDQGVERSTHCGPADVPGALRRCSGTSVTWCHVVSAWCFLVHVLVHATLHSKSMQKQNMNVL